jgi:hypothetical protein
MTTVDVIQSLAIFLLAAAVILHQFQHMRDRRDWRR